MADLLKLFGEWWPDFWPLMIAPPIYGIWLTFLSGPKWTARIRGWLENEAWSGAYAAMLDLLSERLDALFGPKWFGGRAFCMCFVIAVIYAVFWFWVSLALKNANGRIDILIALAIVLPVGGGVWWLSRWTKHRHERARAARPDDARWWMLCEYLCYFCTGGIAVAVAIVVAGAGAFSVEGAFSVAVAFSVAAAVAGAGAVAVAGAGAVAVAGAVVVAGAVIFFLLFPFVNAVFDWLSWAASRWLIERLGRDAAHPVFWRRWGLLAGHVLLDIALALLALLGLATCIAMVLSNGSPNWENLYRDPFSLAGSTYSVMLLSTLVPTAIHLFCAVFAVLPALPLWHRHVATVMPFRRNFDTFEAGDKVIVAGWLTLWSVVSAIVVWLIFKAGVWALDLMWSADPAGRNFWQVLLDTARGIQQWTGIVIR